MALSSNGDGGSAKPEIPGYSGKNQADNKTGILYTSGRFSTMSNVGVAIIYSRVI